MNIALSHIKYLKSFITHHQLFKGIDGNHGIDENRGTAGKQREENTHSRRRVQMFSRQRTFFPGPTKGLTLSLRMSRHHRDAGTMENFRKISVAYSEAVTVSGLSSQTQSRGLSECGREINLPSSYAVPDHVSASTGRKGDGEFQLQMGEGDQ